MIHTQYVLYSFSCVEVSVFKLHVSTPLPSAELPQCLQRQGKGQKHGLH